MNALMSSEKGGAKVVNNSEFLTVAATPSAEWPAAGFVGVS